MGKPSWNYGLDRNTRGGRREGGREVGGGRGEGAWVGTSKKERKIKRREKILAKRKKKVSKRSMVWVNLFFFSLSFRLSNYPPIFRYLN